MTPREAQKPASPEAVAAKNPSPSGRGEAAASGKNQRREISSGIIIFRRTPQGPSFLVLFHGHEQWTFPRGKIEGEERSFAAALRETHEETGISRSDIRFVDYFKAYENWTFVKNNQKVFKTVIFYLAETTKKHVRIEPNFEGYCWFTYREASKIFGGVKNNENRKVLKQAYDFLTKRQRPVQGEKQKRHNHHRHGGRPMQQKKDMREPVGGTPVPSPIGVEKKEEAQ